MKILALELSSPVGSIAFRDERAAVVRQFPADRKDSGMFYETLCAVRQEFGLPEMIVVGLGPGSYAGVRIAIATAVGLRAAAGAQIVGLPSIRAFDCAEYCVIGDARRHSYFFAHVRDRECLEGPSLLSEDELRATLGEFSDQPRLASQSLPGFEAVALAYPSALILAELAQNARGSNEPLEPIYLRAPFITQAKVTLWTR